MRLQPQQRMRAIDRRRRERGATAIVVALAMIALVAFVGLALDLGKLYVAKSELQNSADACALAAARDLDGVTPLAVSEAAGIAAGHINLAVFQSAPVPMTVDNSVTYATSSSGPFQNKDAVTGTLAQLEYVQCTTSEPSMANWLIQVLNLLPGMNVAPVSVSAQAVATNGHAQSTCAIPVFVCDPSKFTPASTYSVGQWLAGKGDATTGTYNQGDFGWANLNSNGPDSCSGQTCLSQQLTGATCSVPTTGQQVRSNGNMSSLEKAYNTRFGIQYSGNGAPQGTSDFTGYAYTSTNWTAGSNAYDGTASGIPNFLSSRSQRQAYQGDGGTLGLKTGGQPGAPAVYEAGADRRLTVAPMVDCSSVTSSSGATVTNWACVLMLDPMQKGGDINSIHLEYRGLAGAAGTPCAAEGTPGAVATGPLVPELIQ